MPIYACNKAELCVKTNEKYLKYSKKQHEKQ